MSKASFGRKPGKKTADAIEKERKEVVTVYVNADGTEWRAETHTACKGQGCAECGGLGFTKLSQGDFFRA